MNRLVREKGFLLIKYNQRPFYYSFNNKRYFLTEKREREGERKGYYSFQLITSDIIPGLFLPFLLLCEIRFSPHQSFPRRTNGIKRPQLNRERTLKKPLYILIDHRKTTILIFIKDSTLEGLFSVVLQVARYLPRSTNDTTKGPRIDLFHLHDLIGASA